MDEATGVSVSYLGIMQALERAANADAERDRIALSIATAEASLWMRALTDHAGVDTGALATRSDEAVLHALRATANKAIHEQIHPHRVIPKFDFMRTMIVSSSFNFAWRPYRDWKALVSDWKIPRSQSDAYEQHLDNRPVVVSLSAAVDGLRNLIPPDNESSRQAVALLDSPKARGRFY